MVLSDAPCMGSLLVYVCPIVLEHDHAFIQDEQWICILCVCCIINNKYLLITPRKLNHKSLLVHVLIIMYHTVSAVSPRHILSVWGGRRSLFCSPSKVPWLLSTWLLLLYLYCNFPILTVAVFALFFSLFLSYNHFNPLFYFSFSS